MENDEIKMFKEQERASMIRGYSNGYTAHWIDMHPRGKTYRTLDNASGLVALPDEQIMLLHRDGPIVMLLKTLNDLDRIEKEMRLVRTVDYPNAQLPPLNRQEE